jgi:hypothetical protein
MSPSTTLHSLPSHPVLVSHIMCVPLLFSYYKDYIFTVGLHSAGYVVKRLTLKMITSSAATTVPTKNEVLYQCIFLMFEK